jgi:FMN reductase
MNSTKRTIDCRRRWHHATEIHIRANVENRARAAAHRVGAQAQMIGSAALNLPFYEPASPARSPAALALVLRPDGIIQAKQSYHGSMSGFTRNALDCPEDLRDAPRPFRRPRGRPLRLRRQSVGSGSTTAALRSMVHALRGWPTLFAAVLTSTTQVVTLDVQTRLE